MINNDATAVTSAVIQALQQLGMIGQAATAPQAPPVPEVELPASFSIGDMLNTTAQLTHVGLIDVL